MLSHYKGKISQWNWYDIPSVTSTNDSIKLLPETAYPAIISAIEQTKGRGRRERSWIAIKGNLYFTYSLEIAPQNLSQYVCLIGLSLAECIKDIAPQSNINIKWPNDIFLENKKLTGILIENIKDNLWAVGIGVNIVDSPKLENLLYQATSLKENNITTTRVDFLQQYMNKFQTILQIYQDEGFLAIKERWLDYAWHLNKEITIKNENNTKSGTFLTLDDNGYLVLKTNKGTERIIAGDLFI